MYVGGIFLFLFIIAAAATAAEAENRSKSSLIKKTPTRDSVETFLF